MRHILILLALSAVIASAEETNAPEIKTNAPPVIAPATNAPAIQDKVPLYVIPELQAARTAAGTIIAVDKTHVKALKKLCPSTQVTIIWTPTGPLLIAERSDLDDLAERGMSVQKIKGVVIYNR